MDYKNARKWKFTDNYTVYFQNGVIAITNQGQDDDNETIFFGVMDIGILEQILKEMKDVVIEELKLYEKML